MQEICKEDPTLVGSTIHKTTSYIWIKKSNYANYNCVLPHQTLSLSEELIQPNCIYVLVYWH